MRESVGNAPPPGVRSAYRPLRAGHYGAGMKGIADESAARGRARRRRAHGPPARDRHARAGPVDLRAGDDARHARDGLRWRARRRVFRASRPAAGGPAVAAARGGLRRRGDRRAAPGLVGRSPRSADGARGPAAVDGRRLAGRGRHARRGGADALPLSLRAGARRLSADRHRLPDRPAAAPAPRHADLLQPVAGAARAASGNLPGSLAHAAAAAGHGRLALGLPGRRGGLGGRRPDVPAVA